MTRKLLVGMLLLGALFVFGLSTFYVKNWQYYLGKGYLLRASFPIVHTLDEGDVVRMAGVPIGTVAKLAINTEAPTRKPVQVVLRIRDEVRVRADDKAVIEMASVFGGSYVSIVRGDPKARELTDDDEIVNTDVTPSITEVVQQAKSTLADMDVAFKDVTAITADIREGKGAFGRLMKDEELVNKLDSVLTNANKAAESLKGATERIDKGEGVLGKLIMNERMAKDVESLVTDMRDLTNNLLEVSEDLRKGEGTLGKLLTTDELHNKLVKLADMAESGEGLLSALLTDPKLTEDMRILTANMKDVSQKLASAENTMGKLLDSDEAYEKLNSSLDNLNEFTASLKEGRGTVGKLVTSDEAYQKLTTLLDSVQDLIDAYREQSPVITFAGAVFGAF